MSSDNTLCLIGYNFEPKYSIPGLEEIVGEWWLGDPSWGSESRGVIVVVAKEWARQKKMYAIVVLTWLSRALKDLTRNHTSIHKYTLKLNK